MLSHYDDSSVHLAIESTRECTRPWPWGLCATLSYLISGLYTLSLYPILISGFLLNRSDYITQSKQWKRIESLANWVDDNGERVCDVIVSHTSVSFWRNSAFCLISLASAPVSNLSARISPCALLFSETNIILVLIYHLKPFPSVSSWPAPPSLSCILPSFHQFNCVTLSQSSIFLSSPQCLSFPVNLAPFHRLFLLILLCPAFHHLLFLLLLLFVLS